MGRNIMEDVEGILKLPAHDPLAFLVDDEIVGFEIDKRHDLAGTGRQACPILSTGQFIVHQHTVPDNTAEVIFDVFPHCWRRDNPTTADETVTLLDPNLVAGWVLFDRASKGNSQPYLVEHDYNVPTLSTAPNDTDRASVRGTTFISRDAPLVKNAALVNPLTTIYLPGGSIFRVLFQLAPQSVASNVPNPWVIGANPEPDTNNRIDMAGALVTGIRMPQALYDRLKSARRNGMIGPEAGVSSLAARVGALVDAFKGLVRK